MKKTLLNEIKAMNRIAGTELTKEQEIALIKTALNEAEDSDVHPWIIAAMEDLRDDLNFYLGQSKKGRGSKIDFGLLKQKMAELVKTIKKYDK